MINTYVIEGGIGKSVAFSAIVDQLAKRDDQKINVYTAYPDVFLDNPNVNMVYDGSQATLDNPEILNSSEIQYAEPYKSNFLKGEYHLIEAFCRVYGIKYNSKMSPKLYTENAPEVEDVNRFLNEYVPENYIIVQFSGGQPNLLDMNKPYMNGDPSRNYDNHLGQQVVNLIKNEKPNTTILHFALPNEPSLQNVIRPDANFRLWHELAKKAEGFIGIDSSLAHLCASAKTKGVVLWGGTRWTQYGYSQNYNLNSYMENTWYESKFDPKDPRNILVDPQIVWDRYKKHIY